MPLPRSLYAYECGFKSSFARGKAYTVFETSHAISKRIVFNRQLTAAALSLTLIVFLYDMDESL